MKLNRSTKQKMKPVTKIVLVSSAVAVASLGLFLVLEKTSSTHVALNSGRCLSFNGTSSGVSFSDDDLELDKGDKMTVTAWVKWSNKTTAGAYAAIVALNSNKTNGDVGQFWLEHNSGNSLFEFAVQNKAGIRSYVQGTTNPSVGTWYHVAGVYNGSTLKLYVNGVLEGTTVFTGDINKIVGYFDLFLGQWAYSGNSYRRFNGHIDEVSIWTIALSQTQVRNMMCKKLKGTETGLASYWRMDETTGSTVTDLADAGRDGTSSNTTITLSGAPVGTSSKYTYGGTSLSLKDTILGDSIYVDNFSTTPAGIFIYRIDTAPSTAPSVAGYVSASKVNYWGVFVINSTGETYRTVYHYGGHPGITDESYLGLLNRTDNTTASWSDLTATLNTTSNTLRKTGQTGRNEYVLATKNGVNPLPIDLLSFEVIMKDGSSRIEWATATEMNNDFFTVERSTDRVSFVAIATVKGAGNSSSKKSYFTTDPDPVSGTSYYRLKQTDYDGKSETFKPVAFNFKNNIADKSFEIVRAYPNPFSSNFTVDLECQTAGILTFQLSSSDGKIIKQEVLDCNEGSNTYSYTDQTGLNSGIYILNISDAGGYKTFVRLSKNK